MSTITESYEGTTVVDANGETVGIVTTVRLFTDKGIYSGTNEGYGSEASFDEACEILKRNVLEDKRRDQTESNSDLKRTQSAELVEWWVES